MQRFKRRRRAAFHRQLDLTCGHCVGAITKAVKSLDADATVSIDLTTRRIAKTAKLSAAITVGRLHTGGIGALRCPSCGDASETRWMLLRLGLKGAGARTRAF